MTTTVSRYFDIDIMPGVAPDTDVTAANTPHWTASDKIRFLKGKPQKIGGWQVITTNGAIIAGCVRTIFSLQVNSRSLVLLGADTGLYVLIGSELINITPLDSTVNAIANSLDTHFDTLALDPISTTSGSDEVIIADPDAGLFVDGDDYVLSGATAVGGIGAGELNDTHMVRGVDSGNNEITIKTLSSATSTATGGGAAVVRTSGLLTVNDVAHGQLDGKRVSISLAVDTGGITAAQINIELIIRNVEDDSFDVMTSGTATSSVSSGGGAATEYLQQIEDGLCDEVGGQGYGMGRYGVGLYGTALLSINLRSLPRIWFIDSFGSNFILTAGNSSFVYSWDGNPLIAPIVVANAPTAINYIFVSDNILVTFGAAGVVNRIRASDQNDITQWTSSSTNQVFTDDIEGAGSLLTHVSLNGTNLIFTANQCYTFRYIGLPLIWETKFKDNIGIISPMARVVVKGVAYWMGQNNFYQWRGGNVEVMKSNSGDESTILNYVFTDINIAQSSKSFAWYNQRYDEIWFHYPSDNSEEVDRVARYHVGNRHWAQDTFDRIAAEYPNIATKFPRLISRDARFYKHEVGTDDDQLPMGWSLTSNMRDFGTNNIISPIMIPDSIQSGDISVLAESFSYPQSPIARNTQDITVSPSTEFSPLNVSGRFIKYTFSGSELGQDWIMGRWKESIQISSRSP